jgi:hypothetical protein
VIGRLAAVTLVAAAPRAGAAGTRGSIDAGRPVERPDVVSCRYAGPCGG